LNERPEERSTVDTPDRRRLPVLPESFVSSLDPKDGRRRLPIPADVHGRFTTARRIVFAILVAFWLIAPLARLGGRPLVLLDVARRQFFLFGKSFGEADVHLLFFVLTGLGFSLVVATAVLGRVFCGFACPQTVFLEGIFRPIERLFEGSRAARTKRDAGGWTAERVLRKALKHAAFVVVAAAIAHASMSLFVSWPGLLAMMKGSPALHPQAFAWGVAGTAVVYGHFAFFREQFCLVMCPYGRLQGVLVDRDTLVVGYDERRGEPRGKATDTEAGACVDCNRCVAVCPTGIDIRNGLQLDCIGCSACIDACDEVMDKLHRPRGLVRFDSQRGLDGEPRRFIRPRLVIYAALGAVGLGVFAVSVAGRDDVPTQVLRAAGAPFVVEGGDVRNAFVLVVNNHNDADLELDVVGRGDGLRFTVESPLVLAPMESRRVPFVVVGTLGTSSRGFEVVLTERGDGEIHAAEGRFLAPAHATTH
jgi:cytochrome c oxidase accessory protein FixG